MKNIEEITEAIRQLLKEENKKVNKLITDSDFYDANGGQDAINKTYLNISRLEAAKTVLTIS